MEGKNLALIQKLAQELTDNAREAEAAMVTFTARDIARLNAEDFCPRNYKALSDGTYPDELTPSELRRAYFRYKTVGLLLESGNRPFLPPIRGGKPSADEKRLDEQAERFAGHLDDYGIALEEVCVPVKLIYNDHVILKDTLPAVATLPDGEGGRRQVVLYPEATGNIRQTFGDRCWGNPWLMDHTRAYFMATIQQILSGRPCHFYYAVYEYSPRMEYDFIEVNLNRTNEMELRENIRKAYQKHRAAEREGWPARPKYEKCKNCPVLECESREKIKPVKHVMNF